MEERSTKCWEKLSLDMCLVCLAESIQVHEKYDIPWSSRDAESMAHSVLELLIELEQRRKEKKILEGRIKDADEAK